MLKHKLGSAIDRHGVNSTLKDFCSFPEDDQGLNFQNKAAMVLLFRKTPHMSTVESKEFH